MTCLLQDLGQVLWQRQCYDWQCNGKAWTTESKIAGCVSWYLKGQNLGEKPIFDSICARCGELLYGNLTDGLSNKANGLPMDIDEQEVLQDSQPPFLLRWTPEFLASMWPDVLSWDAASNRVELREEHRDRPPWKTQGHHRQQDEDKAWLYCKCCHKILFQNSAGNASTIPFRDRQSLAKTPDLQPSPDLGRAPSRSAGAAAKWATYFGKWARNAKRARRKNPQRGHKLKFENLVPTPQSELWQDTPEAPFSNLVSESARGHLSCCNLQSSMREQQAERGRAAYSCSAGEMVFSRRQPSQLSSTMAFILGKDEGQFCRVRASELAGLRECLAWLHEKNPHVKLMWTNAERFSELYGKLQGVLPRGKPEAKVSPHIHGKTIGCICWCA